MEKYLDFMNTLRQKLSTVETNVQRYTVQEKMERLAKLQPKITKLQAAINLDQKAVVRRLEKQIELELEIFRLDNQTLLNPA